MRMAPSRVTALQKVGVRLLPALLTVRTAVPSGTSLVRVRHVLLRIPVSSNPSVTG